jgi:hypothetical protein
MKKGGKIKFNFAPGKTLTLKKEEKIRELMSIEKVDLINRRDKIPTFHDNFLEVNFGKIFLKISKSTSTEGVKTGLYLTFSYPNPKTIPHRGPYPGFYIPWAGMGLHL